MCRLLEIRFYPFPEMTPSVLFRGSDPHIFHGFQPGRPPPAASGWAGAQTWPGTARRTPDHADWLMAEHVTPAGPIRASLSIGRDCCENVIVFTLGRDSAGEEGDNRNWWPESGSRQQASTWIDLWGMLPFFTHFQNTRGRKPSKKP